MCVCAVATTSAGVGGETARRRVCDTLSTRPTRRTRPRLRHRLRWRYPPATEHSLVGGALGKAKARLQSVVVCAEKPADSLVVNALFGA